MNYGLPSCCDSHDYAIEDFGTCLEKQFNIVSGADWTIPVGTERTIGMRDMQNVEAQIMMLWRKQY